MSESTGKVLTIDELREVVLNVQRRWEYIVNHHSATPDGAFREDFDAIKKFHTSWRNGGDIITKEQADILISKGVRVTAPWKDIAYHFVIEYSNNALVLKQGRDLETSGAHTVGMNNKAIGICLVGNYDVKEPADEQYNLLADLNLLLIRKFQIPIENIKPHHYYAAWKSCPGNKFNWMKFAKIIIDKSKG